MEEERTAWRWRPLRSLEAIVVFARLRYLPRILRCRSPLYSIPCILEGPVRIDFRVGICQGAVMRIDDVVATE